MNNIETENINNFKKELKELLEKYDCWIDLPEIQCIDFFFPKQQFRIITDMIDSSTFE